MNKLFLTHKYANHILVCLIPLFLITANSCIEPYTINVEKQGSRKYVINGQVTDQEGYQIVSISATSSLSHPKFHPIYDCNVTIIDDKNNIFDLEEFGDGQYRVWMDKEFLSPGAAFKLAITTSTGVIITSEYDTLQECPDIDSVYFDVEKIETTDQDINGIQFYIDMDDNKTNSKYFRWDIQETWEYHARYPVEFQINIDWSRNIFNPPDYSMYYCWLTGPVHEIFTFTTKILEQNTFKKHPLHFVNNKTTRLTVYYSLLVKQISLSLPAYLYWDQLKSNSSCEGSLYEKQPISIKGNLKCENDPDINVLGFFSASAIKAKRYFFDDFNELELDIHDYCYIPLIEEPLPTEFPLYFVQTDTMIEFVHVNRACVDCREFGGSTVKPDFWPDVIK